MKVGWISPGSTSFESSPSTSLPQPSAGPGSVPIALARASRVGCRAMSIPARSRIASRRAIRRLGDQHLEVVRGLLVVGVGLVPLQHRELGVVLVGDALVTEVLAELVDAVDAADDEALEVELGGDPQVEVAIEGVVVGREWPRQGAAVERLQDRRLDLDEAVLVEPAADLGDRAGASAEGAAALLVGDQVELAAAEAGLGVLQTVELVGRRPQALRQQAPVVDRERELAAATGRHRRALGADDVAEVEVDQQLVGLLAEHVLARVQLDLAAAVADVEEAGLAVAAAGDDPAGDAVPRVGLHPGDQTLVGRPHLGDVLTTLEFVREWIDPRRPDPLELLAAVPEDVGELLPLGWLLAHRGASLPAVRLSRSS